MNQVLFFLFNWCSKNTRCKFLVCLAPPSCDATFGFASIADFKHIGSRRLWTCFCTFITSQTVLDKTRYIIWIPCEMFVSIETWIFWKVCCAHENWTWSDGRFVGKMQNQAFFWNSFRQTLFLSVEPLFQNIVRSYLMRILFLQKPGKPFLYRINRLLIM